MLDEKVKDDEEKGMENASKIREEVVQFFREHEDSGHGNSAQKPKQKNPLLAQSSTESIDSLDQATKFLDSQLLNLGWRLYFSTILFYSQFRWQREENRGGSAGGTGDKNRNKLRGVG